MKPITTAALILAAPAAHAETKTVSWFLAHPEARAKVYALCQDNPGEAKHTPNCINAVEAMSRVSAQEVEKQLKAAGAGRTLIDDCDKMPRLFQQANRCGPLGTPR